MVDNASTDGSSEFVREAFPGVRLLPLDDNVGFGGACNAGIERTSTPLVLILNPDAWPVDDGVEELERCMLSRPMLGAAAPQLESPRGEPQQTLVGLPSPWWPGRPAISSSPVRAASLPVRRRPRRRFVVGAALVLRREALEHVGAFDPGYFMFYEEVDLCWRLQDAGWEVDLCPSARFVHVGGTSTRPRWERMYREQLRGHLRFLSKRDGPATAVRARRYLRWVVRLRMGLALREADRRVYRAAAEWLDSEEARSVSGG